MAHPWTASPRSSWKKGEGEGKVVCLKLAPSKKSPSSHVICMSQLPTFYFSSHKSDGGDICFPGIIRFQFVGPSGDLS